MVQGTKKTLTHWAFPHPIQGHTSSQVLDCLLKTMNRSCSLNPGQLEVLVATTGCVGLLSYVASAFAIVTAIGFYKAHHGVLSETGALSPEFYTCVCRNPSSAGCSDLPEHTGTV